MTAIPPRVLFFKALIAGRPGLIYSPTLDRRGWPTHRYRRLQAMMADEEGSGEGSRYAGPAMKELPMRHLVGDALFEQVVATLRRRTLPPAVAVAGLTLIEQVALHLWTLDTGPEAWFRQINRALRIGNVHEIQRLQPLIAVMRSGLAKLPPFEGTVYRGVKERGFQGDFQKWLDGLQAGAIIDEPGFMGGSINVEQSLRGRIKLIIMGSRGRDISAMSNKPEQQEILYLPSTRLLILRREDSTNKVVRLWAQEQH